MSNFPSKLTFSPISLQFEVKTKSSKNVGLGRKQLFPPITPLKPNTHHHFLFFPQITPLFSPNQSAPKSEREAHARVLGMQRNKKRKRRDVKTRLEGKATLAQKKSCDQNYKIGPLKLLNSNIMGDGYYCYTSKLFL